MAQKYDTEGGINLELLLHHVIRDRLVPMAWGKSCKPGHHVGIRDEAGSVGLHNFSKIYGVGST